MTPEPRHCLACSSLKLEWWADSKDVEYSRDDMLYGYYRCVDCDALTIDPVPLDRLSEIYPESYNSFSDDSRSWIYRVKESLDKRNFTRIARLLSSREISVLDVGGGSGYLADLLKKCDSRVTFSQVVDIDAGAQQAAIRKGHKFFLGRIEEFIPDRKFDLVLMLNLIEHVSDPGLVLRSIREMMNPGGIVLIKTPNWRSLDARLFRHHNWTGFHCPRHWVLFTKESFISLVVKSGFLVEQFLYTQGAPFWAGSIVAKIASLGLTKVTPNRPLYMNPLMGPLMAVFAAVDFARARFFRTSQMYFVLRAP